MTNSRTNMRRMASRRSSPDAISVIFVCLFFFGSGCSAPVKTASSKPASTARSAGRDHAPDPGPTSNAGNSPVTRMRVQGETVEAAELWIEQRDELEARYRELPAQQFRVYVAERSAQLASDKIAEVLLFQHAKLRLPEGADKKIDEYADAEVRKIVTADFGGVQRRFEKKLQDQGRTLDSAREQIRRQIIISSYLDNEVRPRVAEPTRAELYEAFQQNIEAWRKPARRSMSLVDVRINEFLPKGVSEPTREQSDAARGDARKRIEAAQADLRGGLSFADVARKYSQGLHAEEGGAWGFVSMDGVRERFLPAVKALDQLDEGQVSDAVETPEGFFLVRCDRLQPSIEPDFQTVQPLLRDEFFRREYNRRIGDIVLELRKNARIEPENLDRFHEAVIAAAFAIVEPLPLSKR